MTRYIYNTAKLIMIALLVWAIAVFARALFGEPTAGEAYTGSFGSVDFSAGWTMTDAAGNVTENVVLPVEVRASRGDTIRLVNRLPHEIKKGMRLSTRASIADVKIIINDKRRAEYSKRNFWNKRVPVSSFVLANLGDEDADGEIQILITSGRDGMININTVSYAYGNNVWFPYIEECLPVIFMALVQILAGLLAIILYIVFRNKVGVNKSLFYLGIMTAEIGMWMIGENHIRQLIFSSHSYAGIFSYLFIETVSGFGAMFFDEIQSHRYRKQYAVLVAVLAVQVIINSALNFLNIVDYLYTLKYAHIWSGLIIIWIIITIIRDCLHRKIKEYSLIAFGMLGFLIAGVAEMINFYIDPSARLGVRLGIGLLFLMGATIVQAVRDMLSASEEKRMYSEKMNEMIFQTIARTIDPRDGQTSVGRISENIRDLSRQQSDTQHVVIVDDDELNLLMAEDILSGQNIEVTCLSSGNELLEYVGSNTPDLILLDICMPVMDGFETLKELKKIMADSEEIPVIFLSAAEEDESETRGLRLGAVDFIKKPFEPDVLLLRVRRTIELARLQKDLASEIDRKSRENEALSLHVVQTLAEAIDAKDTYTNGHSTRVAQYSREIARRYGYSKKAQEDIYMMGLLHDVGKIGVPDEIINKPARLTDEEFELIKAHPVIGCNILQKIEEMPKLQTGAHWHHERYDGKGYPDGLAGEDIPEEARIIAVADAYDAMTSRRSYRDILPQEVVKGEIEKGRGLQFDPTFADIMLEIIADDITYGLKES